MTSLQVEDKADDFVITFESVAMQSSFEAGVILFELVRVHA